MRASLRVENSSAIFISCHITLELAKAELCDSHPPEKRLKSKQNKKTLQGLMSENIAPCR